MNEKKIKQLEEKLEDAHLDYSNAMDTMCDASDEIDKLELEIKQLKAESEEVMKE